MQKDESGGSMSTPAAKPAQPTDDAIPLKRRRSFVRDLLDLLTANHTLDDEACATYLGVTKRTVFLTRSADSFKSLLALSIQKQHGDAIMAVRNNTLLAANEALEAGRRMLADSAIIPSLKIEVMKVVLDNHQRSEERLIPKGPTGGQTGQVSINLTFNELQEARQSALDYGKNLELEASNHAHATEIQMPGYRMLAGVNKDGS